MGRYIFYLPYIMITVFICIPVLALFSKSFFVQGSFEFSRYITVITDPFYIYIIFSSIFYVSVASLLTVIFAFPVSYMLATMGKRYIAIAMLSIIFMQMLSSFFIKIHAMILCLSKGGIFYNILYIFFGDVNTLHNNISMLFTMLYVYIPYAIFILYIAIRSIETQAIELAVTIGMSKGAIIKKIIIPNILPTFSSIMILVSIPLIGDLAIPELVGGTRPSVGHTIWMNAMRNNIELSSTICVIIFIILGVLIFCTQYFISKYVKFASNKNKHA